MEKKRSSWTVAIGFILLGIVLLLSKMDLVSLSILKYIFPSLIILFGIEIIVVRLRYPKQTHRLGGWSIIFVVFLIIGSIVSSIPFLTFGPGYLNPVNGQLSVDSTIKHVVIALPNAKVHLTGTSDSTLTYQGEIKEYTSSQTEAANKLKKEWVTKKDGDTIRLELNQQSHHFISFGGWGSPSYLNIKLPNNLITKVHTSNGSIKCSNTNGAIVLHTTNGSIEANNVEGDVTIESSNGAINSEQIKGSLNIQTSNGAVSVNNIKGPITVHTSNGRIEADSPIEGKWILQTSNGAINMTIPSDSNANVSASTSNGGIGGNVTWTKNGKNNGTITIGQGNDTVIAHTSNGHIILNTK